MKTLSPNDFGKKLLAEQCQKIKISDFVRASKARIMEILIKSSIEASGHNVLLSMSKTGFGGSRFWFSCPICHKRAGVLYKHPTSQILACRKCLKLDYRKHRYKGMTEIRAG